MAPADNKTHLLNQIEAFLANPDHKPEALIHKDLQELLHDINNMYAELEMQHAELKKSQDELEFANKKLMKLLNKSPFGIALVDEYATFTYVNDTFKKLFADYSSSKVGGDLRRMIAPEMQDDFEHFARQLKKNKCGYLTKTFQFDNHAGHIQWIKLSAEAFEKTNEQNIYLFVFEDITDQKKAQKELEKTNQILHTIAEHSIDIIALFDLNLTIEWISPSIGRTGLKPEAMIGRNALEFIHPEDQDSIFSAFQKRVAQLDFGVSEYRFQNPEGKWFWSEATGKMLVDQVGKPSKLLVVSRLIDERKAAEKALMESYEKLKTANQTKDKLFSIIAHDLRSPFNSLLGLSEIMADGQFELDMAQLRQMGHTLHKTATAAFQLLEDLLEWSRLERNMIEPHKEPVDIRYLLNELVYLFESECEKKKIVVEQQIDMQNPQITTDRRLLFTALRNLLSNAIKFSNIGAKVLLLIEEYDEGYLRISLIDKGIGIPKDLLPSLFTIDDRKTRPGTMNEKSTGLGLVIAREMIRLLEGQIEVESREGEGSTFYILLPADFIKN